MFNFVAEQKVIREHSSASFPRRGSFPDLLSRSFSGQVGYTCYFGHLCRLLGGGVAPCLITHDIYNFDKIIIICVVFFTPPTRKH